MAKAKIITDAQLDGLLDRIVVTSKFPERDLAVIMLSHKAGLRACEIAGLTWRDVTDAGGNISRFIEVPSGIAKNGRARVVEMHPLITEALEIWQMVYGQVKIGDHVLTPARKPTGKERIILSIHAGSEAPFTPKNMAHMMSRLYQRHGLSASSHSGRRSLLTKLARSTNDYDCSLFDVQQIAGHSSVMTTEEYVELSPNAGRMLRSM